MAKRSSMVQAGAAGAVAAGAAGVAAAAKVAHDRRVRRRRAFRVGDGEDTATATRRIARGQIDLASERLAQSSGDGLGEAVHDARKRLKRLRAVLKLVRDDVGDPVYRR